MPFIRASSRRAFPSSLSQRVITDLLRGELGFRGLVMTDDLDMGAILNHFGLEETIRLAISAGNDLAMICHRVNVVEEALGHLAKVPRAELDRALANVAEFKRKLAPPRSIFRRGIPPPRFTRLGFASRSSRPRTRCATQPGRREAVTGGDLLSGTGT
jgi:beta-glucosidase-like glycosyl hydrolase